MNKHAITLALVTAALLGSAPLTAQEPPAPQPTREHQKLAAQVGVWNAEMKFVDPASGQEMTATGTSVRKMPLGGFWVLDNFQANIMGQVFKGHGQTGYDPVKQKYVGTWIDSMSPSMMVFEGTYDDTGKVLTMTGDGAGVDGKPTPHRLVTTVVDNDKHVFEMFMTLPDGKEMKLMTITYTRKKPQRDEVERK